MSLKWLLLFSINSFINFLSLVRQARTVRSADVVYVPYPAYLDVMFLKCILLGRSKPIVVIDAFLCLYDTLIDDRKLFSPHSLIALLVSWLESGVLSWADLIFIDTSQQKDVLLKRYALCSEKIAVTPVGIDETVWTPLDPLPLAGRFRVLFWGTFIPLHGVETIINAAEKLQKSHPEIEVRLVGDGQVGNLIASQIASLGLVNISWERALVGSAELRSEVKNCHCILGIFGSSAKAGNVVPYKVYQAMASNKIVISREGPAISGVLHGRGENAGLVLVRPADPEALASAIVNIYEKYNIAWRNTETRKIYDACLSNGVLKSQVQSALASYPD